MLENFNDVMARQSDLAVDNNETTIRIFRLYKENAKMKEQMSQFSSAVSQLSSSIQPHQPGHSTIQVNATDGGTMR